MPVEAFTDNAQTQLSAAIASTSATVITVSSATGFPSGQLLTANQASIETGTTGWTTNPGSGASGNCVASQTTSQALDGTHSLALTSSASGDMYTYTPIGTSGVPVTAGASYTAYAFFRAATTGRNVQVGINWYNSGGTLLTGAYGAQVADTTTGWVQATNTLVAPVNAAFAAIIVYVVGTTAANEVHYVDVVWFAQGGLTQWRILVDSELMLVNGGHGLTTWIVTRGIENTTAATHLINATVLQPLTAGALANTAAQGILNYARVTTSQGPTAPPFDITGCFVAVTLVSGRRYKISAQTLITSSVASDAIQLAITEDSTDVMLTNETSPGGVSGSNRASVVRFCPSDVSAGSHTYKLRAARNGGGTGNFTNNAGTSFPSFILVEDIGAS